ncbi:MAG: FAD-binding oxidoreductase [Cyanobacteria bacterium]|nr:FAD-binding oxidoreductase [Cyanobacteriota bacterium]
MTAIPLISTEQMLAPLPASLAGLRAVDGRWQAYRQGTLPTPTVITVADQDGSPPDWDVVIGGGTLGILLGVALVQQGWRVALLERGSLRGRDQEWNISRAEITHLVTQGLLTEAELETAIATEYNPARIQFGNSDPLWVKDILNVGIDPVYLLETLKQHFIQAGGTLLEQTPFDHATVHHQGVTVHAGTQVLNSRLFVDAMGHFSPLVQQVRQGQKPDGVCLVVGTCAEGFAANATGDLMVSFTPIQNQCQYFWEAFPAREGRTTYLFTYVDAEPDRPSLETLFDEYWRLLPEYQGISLQDLTLKRALFGFFPCYRDSPIRYPWARILPVGDSSGSQSPLSFGGFGSMVRHLGRLTTGIDEALGQDCLTAGDLQGLQPYQPNLSVTWLFQQAMRVGVDQPLDPGRINHLLGTIFADMAALGEPTLKPFLQDVVQFSALAKTLLRTTVYHPGLVAQLLPQVGLPAVLRWLPHYAALGGYSGLYPLAQTLSPLAQHLPPRPQYRYRRWLDALRYGTGNDYGS